MRADLYCGRKDQDRFAASRNRAFMLAVRGEGDELRVHTDLQQLFEQFELLAPPVNVKRLARPLTAIAVDLQRRTLCGSMRKTEHDVRRSFPASTQRAIVQTVGCSEQRQDAEHSIRFIACEQNAVFAGCGYFAAVVQRQIGQLSSFGRRKRQALLATNESRPVLWMRGVANAAADIMHRCRPSEQSKVPRLKTVHRAGDIEQIRRQFDDPAFMVDRSEPTLCPSFQRRVNFTPKIPFGALGVGVAALRGNAPAVCGSAGDPFADKKE
jgi:hypothetical protein